MAEETEGILGNVAQVETACNELFEQEIRRIEISVVGIQIRNDDDLMRANRLLHDLASLERRLRAFWSARIRVARWYAEHMRNCLQRWLTTIGSKTRYRSSDNIRFILERKILTYLDERQAEAKRQRTELKKRIDEEKKKLRRKLRRAEARGGLEEMKLLKAAIELLERPLPEPKFRIPGTMVLTRTKVDTYDVKEIARAVANGELPETVLRVNTYALVPYVKKFGELKGVTVKTERALVPYDLTKLSDAEPGGDIKLPPEKL